MPYDPPYTYISESWNRQQNLELNSEPHIIITFLLLKIAPDVWQAFDKGNRLENPYG
jgi:hypothetical protein